MGTMKTGKTAEVAVMSRVDLLRAALEGLRARMMKTRLEAMTLLEELNALSRPMAMPKTDKATPDKADRGRLSPAAKRRIAEGQRKRWEKYRKDKRKKERADKKDAGALTKAKGKKGVAVVPKLVRKSNRTAKKKGVNDLYRDGVLVATEYPKPFPTAKKS